MDVLGTIFNIFIVLLAVGAVVFAVIYRIKTNGRCCGGNCEKCKSKCGDKK